MDKQILDTGCTNCGHVNKGFVLDDEGRRVCQECGGFVLTLQEALDKMFELKARIDDLELQTGDDYDDTDSWELPFDDEEDL